jgi:pSer/pThr/pTyr-binding forkhead associated (FHA) protein
LKGARELIVEDLNSTNGVMVNGRKVTRHLLADGDTLTVGEIQFRCVIKSKPAEGGTDQGRPNEARPGEGQPGQTGAQAAPAAVTNLADVRSGDGPKAEPRG